MKRYELFAPAMSKSGKTEIFDGLRNVVICQCDDITSAEMILEAMNICDEYYQKPLPTGRICDVSVF